MSLSQLKNRKLNRFQAHGYGLRSQSPERSPGKAGPMGTSSDAGLPGGPIDIEDQQRGAHHAVSQSGILPPHDAHMATKGQPFFSTRGKKQLMPPLAKGALGESLNGHQRKQEMSRILIENEALLKRLQNR
jgi:hypothetical protein